MSGKKGRSGRRKLRDEEKRQRVIELSWDIVEEYLKDETIELKDRIKTAEKIATKDVPQEVEAEIREIARMPSVKVNGQNFVPIVGQEPKEEDDTITEDATDSTEADTTDNKD